MTGLIRRRTEVAEAPGDFDSTGCKAAGCPLPGSVSVGSTTGPFCCSHHAFAEAKDWTRITSGLRDHDWYLGLLADLRKLLGEGKWKEAIAFAREFWAEYPEMHPNEHETRHVEAYLYRLFLDLQHRIGARPKPAGPMEPQSAKWKSNRIQLSKEEA